MYQKIVKWKFFFVKCFKIVYCVSEQSFVYFLYSDLLFYFFDSIADKQNKKIGDIDFSFLL